MKYPEWYISFVEMLALSKKVDLLARIFGPASVPDGLAKDTVTAVESKECSPPPNPTTQKIKLMDSATARKLNHIEYRKSHGAITSAKLKSLWNALPDDEKALTFHAADKESLGKEGKSESQTKHAKQKTPTPRIQLQINRDFLCRESTEVLTFTVILRQPKNEKASLG
ncbi:hypothetical protein B0H10DRAFT_1948960 [Mycena sp. CBHHK59/15]|nr:hypothetical protein B0H10DRAFT_1948960 [Mycena sp. CBHHK59/15]